MVALPLLIIVVLVFAGSYYWARRQGLLEAESAPTPQGDHRISLLTEAVAYVGAILLLAGGGAAIAQRWEDISAWGHVGVFAGTAVFFLVLGVAIRGIAEPAVRRLVGVVWFLSAVALAPAVGVAMDEVYEVADEVIWLSVGLAITAYAAILWFIRQQALQHLALFVGFAVTISAVIANVADEPPAFAFALALWGFGLGWAVLGWLRYLEPLWVAVPLGIVLALTVPSIAVGEYGWMYAVGIVTAAAVMAVSVPLHNTMLLALGTLAMFSYVTSTVVRYFGDTLGVPAALAITGALILGLAVVSVRLLRATRLPQPGEPSVAGPPPGVPQPGETSDRTPSIPASRRPAEDEVSEDLPRIS